MLPRIRVSRIYQSLLSPFWGHVTLCGGLLCPTRHRNSNKRHHVRLFSPVCLKCQVNPVKERQLNNADIGMLRREMILGLAAVGLAGCDVGADRPLGPDGLPLPAIYRIRPRDAASVQFRVLDGVNSLRTTAGIEAVALDASLNAAAATHARDMAVQNRPWLFGSDGSSPLDRARRVGFQGRLLGENISESFESELQTLAAWMAQEDTRSVIMDPNARFMGFAWYQEEAGKLWWTLNMGSDPAVTQPIQNTLS